MRRAALLGVLLLAVLAGCQHRAPTAREYLRDAWAAYKPVYVAEQGYVLDRTRGDGSTSTLAALKPERLRFPATPETTYPLER